MVVILPEGGNDIYTAVKQCVSSYTKQFVFDPFLVQLWRYRGWRGHAVYEELEVLPGKCTCLILSRSSARTYDDTIRFIASVLQ